MDLLLSILVEIPADAIGMLRGFSPEIFLAIILVVLLSKSRIQMLYITAAMTFAVLLLQFILSSSVSLDVTSILIKSAAIYLAIVVPAELLYFLRRILPRRAED